MKTLEEAIKHAEYIASKYSGAVSICWSANDNRQLAALLRELQERRKMPEIITCGECKYRELHGIDGFCDHITGEPIMVKKTDYCSWAERRIDD